MTFRPGTKRKIEKWEVLKVFRLLGGHSVNASATASHLHNEDLSVAHADAGGVGSKEAHLLTRVVLTSSPTQNPVDAASFIMLSKKYRFLR